jgi:hypothetical protein
MTPARLKARMDSLFSFPVGLFHPLQHAGFSPVHSGWPVARKLAARHSTTGSSIWIPSGLHDRLRQFCVCNRSVGESATQPEIDSRTCSGPAASANSVIEPARPLLPISLPSISELLQPSISPLRRPTHPTSVAVRPCLRVRSLPQECRGSSEYSRRY